jgi:hypothetical protein
MSHRKQTRGKSGEAGNRGGRAGQGRAGPNPGICDVRILQSIPPRKLADRQLIQHAQPPLQRTVALIWAEAFVDPLTRGAVLAVLHSAAPFQESLIRKEGGRRRGRLAMSRAQTRTVRLTCEYCVEGCSQCNPMQRCHAPPRLAAAAGAAAPFAAIVPASPIMQRQRTRTHGQVCSGSSATHQPFSPYKASRELVPKSLFLPSKPCKTDKACSGQSDSGGRQDATAVAGQQATGSLPPGCGGGSVCKSHAGISRKGVAELTAGKQALHATVAAGATHTHKAAATLMGDGTALAGGRGAWWFLWVCRYSSMRVCAVAVAVSCMHRLGKRVEDGQVVSAAVNGAAQVAV